MRSRQIHGLIWASSCQRPAGIPVGRPRGRKLAGVSYEKALARAIPGATHGQWFQFQDSNGPGHCQTDVLLSTPWGWAILEAKYTWTQQGHWQVERLYKPVVEKALRAPVFGLVVCKVLTAEVSREVICRDLESAVARAASGRRTVLHWLGTGLGPLQPAAQPAHLAADLRAL